MKYFSEVTKSIYDTEADLKAAEEKLINEKAEKEAEKALKAKQIEELEKVIEEKLDSAAELEEELDALYQDIQNDQLKLKKLKYERCNIIEPPIFKILKELGL